MKIIQDEKDLLLKGVKDFNIAQTLECGQCFRFKKLEESKYIVIAKNKFLIIEQNKDELIFYDTTIEEFDEHWREYFDLDRDYGKIKSDLINGDKKMEEVIDYGSGIRILNQDFLEVLISFIISQNKQIPQIKQVLNLLSMKYGEEIGEYEGEKFYGFPTFEVLSALTEDDFRELKAGFRARYLVDACENLDQSIVKEEELLLMNYDDALESLCLIKGVGVKVGNCVLLFGLKKRNAFPIDVWIRRIMEDIYFREETKLDIIQKFAKDKFAEYGGYAQQYLFYYSRENQVK